MPYRIDHVTVIDVGSERKKPVFMSVEEFAEKLKQFSKGDYYTSDEPYYMLVEASRGQPGLFDQYAEVLKAAAHTKEKLDSTIDKKIESFKWTFIECLGEVSSILDYINRVERDPDTADRVSVLPLMCGSGKSTAITKKIKEVIERNDKTGLLYVTDSKDRLKEIWNENTENPLLNDEERSFIKAHQNDVTILTRDNYDKAIQKVKKYPVLAMTTQRYFNVLTKGEIEEFLKWKDEGTRPLILFDEEPYLNGVFDLTPKTVNDIDTMLRMVLDDDPALLEDKQWCIQQWEAFREKFLALLWEYEYDHECDMIFYEDEKHALTEDDERFFCIINQCKTDIRVDNIENFKNIYAFKAFVDTWSIYSHRTATAGAYESKFTVFLDNSGKVKDLGAKVIVLDATGDISPLYAGQDYIDMRSGENFARPLSHLKIKLADIDTSKTALFTRSSLIPRTVTSFLDAEGYNSNNAYIFTYKGREDSFTAFKKRTAHFGNIKGSNEYADAECIAQVGLNEMQPVHYLVHLLARDDELRSTLEGLSAEESYNRIQDIMKEKHNCADIKVDHVLADIDQNMFRSAIRTAKNRKDVTYYLFYKHSRTPQLREAIEKRYCGLLGGRLETVSAETVAAFEPIRDDTAEDKLNAWLTSWDGHAIKQATLREEAGGITRSAFNNVLNRNSELKHRFQEYSETAKENGHGNGWYMRKMYS